MDPRDLPAHGTDCPGLPHPGTHRLGVRGRTDLRFPQRPAPAAGVGGGNVGRPPGPLAHPRRYAHRLSVHRRLPARAPDLPTRRALARFPGHPVAGNRQGAGRPHPSRRPVRPRRPGPHRPCHVAGDHHQQRRQDHRAHDWRVHGPVLRFHRSVYRIGGAGPYRGLSHIQNAPSGRFRPDGQGHRFLVRASNRGSAILSPTSSCSVS